MDEREKGIHEKIKNKSARLGIVGMGYVGLPLAVEFGNAGFSVTGIDTDAERVQALQSGTSYIPDTSSEALRVLVLSNRFRATSDPTTLKSVDAIILCVPTPLRKTKDPDLSYVLSAVEMLRLYIQPGQLIILESTTYPGTTEEVLLPMLEEKGLKVGVDFYLAFSPERVDPGNKRFTTRNTPKVVSGITAGCRRLSAALYGQVVDEVVPVSSTKVAETVKLLENTFRSVNIALVNEFALMCQKLGIDVWEVIDTAATKPFGFLPFYPGPGIGGHCIPVDPYYLSWKARQNGFEPRFIDLASQVNGSMPAYVVGKISEALNQRGKCLNGSKMMVMGVAYKKDINDMRESPALDIISVLIRQGVHIEYHDPNIPSFEFEGMALQSKELSEEILAEQDCVVIVTNHTTIDYQKVVKASQLIMDARNALKGTNDPRIIRL